MGAAVAVRVDVDTRRGLLRGAPRILDALAAAGAKATFCVAMGPDRWGRAVFRAALERGFLAKLWRTRGLADYGLSTLLNGTLLPGPLTGAGHPEMLRRIAAAGHEVIPHGWDHLAWQMGLDRRGTGWLEDQVRRAFEACERALGARPAGWAAPSWRCSDATLALVDSLGLAYSADSRGEGPFLPRGFRTPQIPVTLPVAEEAVGLQTNAAGYNDWLLARLRPEALNVYAVHAEVEGGPLAGRFRELLGRLAEGGAAFLRHDQVAGGLNAAELPVCALERRRLPGRSLEVSVQGSAGGT